ncbi:hypothetical protein FA95DRAFT_1588178 [Auriscalpium vulgare]|uniref:Uncharacterized protein n=1 Tax=Auriscalpium vulgare TaxID=40419 RepID=A0ACB8RZQ8_9AGAM|nr:hypothetical protein FA95DRAFT_1588178 [Auriscalpium vulgare]
MSTVIEDVSQKLAQYLLRGWIMTDNTCPTAGCRRVPLLRSPPAQSPEVLFCANCEGDGKPNGQSSQAADPPLPSSPSITSSTHYSRPSTPPTEVSSNLSSPTFAPPIETEESIRRRQQSDQASAEIGRRLLRGWAMLADECPNPTCYGIPLVRPPKVGGAQNPRKECVVCDRAYVDEKDANSLLPVETGNSRRITSSSGELAEGSQRTERAIVSNIPLGQTHTSESPTDRRLGSYQETCHRCVLLPSTSYITLTLGGKPIPSTLPSLEAARRSLELALTVLSQRLTTVAARTSLDPMVVGQTADAIGKTALALSHVKQAQENEI